MENFNSSVSPVSLYAEDYETLISFFQMKPDALVQEYDVKFCDLIYSHINRVRKNPVTIVPPLDEDIIWLNTSRPLNFDVDLRNKVYVVDFFTYCCINCIHVLPYLKKVETEYKDNPGFAVIGIHSPKFINEKNTERVKDALILNDISHPVINDFNCRFWKKYEVTCWPTVFIVGPQNMILFVLVGESQIDKLPFMCQKVMQFYESYSEELDMMQVPLMPLSRPVEKELYFPCNVSSNNELILVSDTGHNCLLLMSRNLELQAKIGSSAIGCQDGPFSEASFNAPHGTAWFNHAVFVADTGNHCIRKVDFFTQKVSTIFKMRDEICDVEEPATSTSVADPEVAGHCDTFQSPWDICVGPELGSDLTELNILYIAVAGSHQIWCLYMKADNLCRPFAGSGCEENRQNSYRFKAGFAQPSGIAYSDVIPEFLFVADSESSTIKSISLIDGSVKIVVGGALDPLDLFAFGDIDGKGRDVKLQHPMSICVINDNTLAIADTYNHKIKLVDIKDRSCSTLENANLGLCEPSGICTIDDKLIIADTNNHQLKQVVLEGLVSPLLSPTPFKAIESLNLSPECTSVTKIQLRYGGNIDCFFKMDMHPRYSLASLDTPWEVSFEGDTKCAVRSNLIQLFNVKNVIAGTPPVVIKANQCSLVSGYYENSQCILTFTVSAQLCDGVMKVCTTKDITFKITVEFSKVGAKHVKLVFKAGLFDFY